MSHHLLGTAVSAEGAKTEIFARSFWGVEEKREGDDVTFYRGNSMMMYVMLDRKIETQEEYNTAKKDRKSNMTAVMTQNYAKGIWEINKNLTCLLVVSI